MQATLDPSIIHCMIRTRGSCYPLIYMHPPIVPGRSDDDVAVGVDICVLKGPEVSRDP